MEKFNNGNNKENNTVDESNDKFAHFICNFLIVVILGIIFNPVIGLAGAIIASFVKKLMMNLQRMVLDGIGKMC